MQRPNDNVKPQQPNWTKRQQEVIRELADEFGLVYQLPETGGCWGRRRGGRDAWEWTRNLSLAHADLIGIRVKLREDRDVYPHCLVKAGEIGTVTYVDDHRVGVTLETYHRGLDEWHNEVEWTDNDPQVNEYALFWDDVEILDCVCPKGWTVENTGGGCMAFEYHGEGWYAAITEPMDPSLPVNRRRVGLGIFTEDAEHVMVAATSFEPMALSEATRIVAQIANVEHLS